VQAAGAADQSAQRFPHRGGRNARKQGISTLLVDGEFRDTRTSKSSLASRSTASTPSSPRWTKGLSILELRPLVEKALKLGKGNVKLLPRRQNLAGSQH
jgi:hypothetical protein